MNRSIREEQDAAYLESMRQDEEKVCYVTLAITAVILS